MKILIVEDDFTSRMILQKILGPYGDIHLAINGKEAIEFFQLARDGKKPYDLILLDIMMPEMDGHTALKEIRKIEEENGIFGNDGAKIIMTTALDDKEHIMEAFKSQCEAYLIKPIDGPKLLDLLRKFSLVE